MVTELLINAIVSGILLGGLYAALTVGISLSFGMLDIVNIAHPAFILLGGYVAFLLNSVVGIDPVVAGIIAAPVFFVLGAATYQFYYGAFERHGRDPMRGLAFFFGLMIVIEVLLTVVFGVDYRYVQTPYMNSTLHFGFVDVPLRMLVPFATAVAMVGALLLYLSRSFTGRLVMAVSQDVGALRFLAADPINVKRMAFGLSIATASIAGALLIIVQPIEPSIGREYIGRIFAICVLGGLQSLPGMVIGAMLIGIIESITATFYGPSWSPAISFGLLLFVLAFRPAGIFGR